jgi:transposase-like protein
MAEDTRAFSGVWESLNHNSRFEWVGNRCRNTERANPQHRRRWSPNEKLRIVEQSLALNASVPEVARLHNVNANTVYRWRQETRTGTLSTTPEEQARFALVAVADAGRECPRSMVEVVLRNGRVLRLLEGAVPAHVAQLADALEGCRS